MLSDGKVGPGLGLVQHHSISLQAIKLPRCLGTKSDRSGGVRDFGLVLMFTQTVAAQSRLPAAQSVQRAKHDCALLEIKTRVQQEEPSKIMLNYLK